MINMTDIILVTGFSLDSGGTLKKMVSDSVKFGNVSRIKGIVKNRSILYNSFLLLIY